ncbi:Rho GTPase activation protein, partial [Mytilinidion resinicola]
IAASKQESSGTSRRDLGSWWKKFQGQAHAEAPGKNEYRIFGVALDQSIMYANVAISLFNEAGESYIYGYVPIIVGKCGVFLKGKATGVEGIFVTPGQQERVQELKVVFHSPERYGKGFDWAGYSVHDAASTLILFLENLPEPVIPYEWFKAFDTAMPNEWRRVMETIEEYQSLIRRMPAPHRQLLLYLLDFFVVFAAKSDYNKATCSVLASKFQHGILRRHDDVQDHSNEYETSYNKRVSQGILVFLIENQDHFLI